MSCKENPCAFCKSGMPRTQLTDGSWGHEFQNPDHPVTPVAWFEPCSNPPRHGEPAPVESKPINHKMGMKKSEKRRYIDLYYSYFSGPDDGVIGFQKVIVVKTRKPHFCATILVNELHEIPAGAFAVSDTTKYDGSVGTCYMCLPCLDAWDRMISRG